MLAIERCITAGVQVQRRCGSPKRPQEQGFIAETSIKRLGEVRDITARGSLVMFSPLPESRESAIPALPEIFRSPSLMAEDTIRAVLQDILETANRMMVSPEQMTYDVFLADLKPQEAVVRTLEILGKATQQIPDEFRQHTPHIPWKSLAGMRDKRMHVTVLPGPFSKFLLNPSGSHHNALSSPRRASEDTLMSSEEMQEKRRHTTRSAIISWAYGVHVECLLTC
jgi:uncharacterized protein with HEPN domain